ncbi:uncharacterized protein LOC141673577 [Apium graveolens]|uniref:uncharacterized protein LOC141673577 n=1 Tax=Apium graveolens TaxID=4045 RepID=UPI003D78F90F
MSKYHIEVKVRLVDLQEWCLTGFYGEPDRNKRRITRELLRNLARDANLPWCVVGDLNNIMSANDKKGGESYPDWLIEGFNEVIHDTNLVDLELTGHQFTWKLGRDTDDWMEIRLDRALTNESWLNYFPLEKLYKLDGAPSDHSAILLVPQILNRKPKVYRFKFENAWTTEPMCEQLVRESWLHSQDNNIQEKIKMCSDNLAVWGKEITGNFSGRIKECKAELRRYKKGCDAVSKERYKIAKEKLDSIFNQREIFWRQRSKQLWLQTGDKNSKYFHKIASGRRRNNHIQRLQDGNGNWLDW